MPPVAGRWAERARTETHNMDSPLSCGIHSNRKLSVDNVIQITSAITSGLDLKVDEFRHSDLFPALCVDGGRIWGVVVSVAHHTHPSTPVIAAFFGSTIN